MTWTGVVWRLDVTLGAYEAPQQDSGRHTFPKEPEVGSALEINGEQCQVVAVGEGGRVSKRFSTVPQVISPALLPDP